MAAETPIEFAELDNFTNDSAMMIAFERALETERPDALIRDPLAKFLKGSKGEKLSTEFGAYCGHFQFEGWPEFHKMWTAVRTKFIDDRLIQAISTEPAVSQLVNLGAGLDTRSFRLECFKELKAVFEVDMEVVNSGKMKVLEKLNVTPFCEKYEIISIDFLDKDKSLKAELSAKDFNEDMPTVFFAEGLIQYLGDAKDKFLSDVSAIACKGSLFILQYLEVPAEAGDLAAAGLTEAQLREHFGKASWQLEFYKFGDDALNFGRYDRSKFLPSPMFSFMVATKSQ
jgi:methyltransferase (TIGR00027 family)